MLTLLPNPTRLLATVAAVSTKPQLQQTSPEALAPRRLDWHASPRPDELGEPEDVLGRDRAVSYTHLTLPTILRV